MMDVMYPCCCGLDVHKKTVVACLRIHRSGQRAKTTVRTFSTMTPDLLALCDWLELEGCSHVAMESTGVYWKPIYNLMEGMFELLLVNAQHLKAVPGRKTDVKDAEWLAELLQHGLLKGSFVPPPQQRALRELTRYRTTLVQERVRVVNRLQKVLEDANIKLASVATDIMGKSGRDMLDALVHGQSDPALLADLARGRMREKLPQLEKALTGIVKDHHRFLLAEQLAHIDYLDASILRISTQIREALVPFEQKLAALDSIPGLSLRTAEILLAEIGTDLRRFSSAKPLASWAGMCPGHNESAGKRRSGRTRKGSRWLRTALLEAAHGAAHTKDTYLSAQYRRLCARRGKKRALVAVGHSILVIAYHVLTRNTIYQDLGANYFDERDHRAVERRLVKRLEKLGYDVTVTPKDKAA
jgi:transposase